MCRSIRTVVVVLSTLVLSPMALIELAAQEFHYTGGAVEGTQVRTNNAPFGIVGSGSSYTSLPSSSLTVHVNPGDDNLFVFEFEAECHLRNFADVNFTPGVHDHVSVQARLNGLVGPPSGRPSALQPQSLPTDLEVCGSFAHQTISKSWAVRLAGGASGADWTFSIRVQVVDVFSDDSLTVTFDDRMVRITRYD